MADLFHFLNHNAKYLKFFYYFTGNPVKPGLMQRESFRGVGEMNGIDPIKRRIDEAAKYVPLDQLGLSGQCGFSSTVEGNTLTYDQQVAKLRLIVDVARDIWG